ncbi:MAG: prolyl oligopeptidase family serine peptidase [Bryobacteraceae bacterium]|jgi:dipeptidyl aminopeptidase/acylaminoacyl peptidase
MRKTLVFLGLALFAFQARPAGNFSLTIDNIMRGPALVGYEPAGVRWSHDSQRIFFQWKQATDQVDAPMATYEVNRDGSGLRKLTDDEIKRIPPANGDTSKDRRWTVYSQAGDVFLFDNSSGAIRQITKTADAELNPRFLPGGKRISFTRGGNLFVMSLDNGYLEQVTDIRAAAVAGAAPAAAAGGGRGGRGGGGGGGRGGGGGGRGDGAAASVDQQVGTPAQEYLKKEQKELLEYVRERAALRDEEAAKRKAEPPARKPFTLQARESAGALQLSPDGKYVIASVFESAANAKSNAVPNYITDSGYTEEIPGRTNVGDVQGRSRLAILSVETGDVKWVDHGQKSGVLPREVQLSEPVWSEDGSKAVLAGRSADNKDRWIFALDPATGATRVLDAEHDNAWVGGPAANTLGWMKNGREVYFQSERTGYAQLYAVAFEGGEPRALTTGNTTGKWEVLAVRQSDDKSRFYITASKDTPYENHLYTMDGNGGDLTRITKTPGKHTTTIAPDEKWVADIYSYTNKPPDVYVQENRPMADAKRLTTSPSAEFSQYSWLDAPIVEFAARDGVKVPARLFKPASFKRGGPAVIFIHGAGYLQNVDRWWSSSYYHEYMFDHILMDRGYLVIDVDYRGSAGYGRDWRTAVYEHMGGKDLDDIVDAAKYVVAQYGVDPKKIGTYGGSYGGFLTLMALFTQPDTFAAGAALRPVSDWALYNHGYTSAILNEPQNDPEAYRKSSPIFFAQNLKGALLICHGMVDTNVEFEDTVRLTQRLIELHKENWQLAVYPVENHGFVQPSSWADEYKRILALYEKNLK